jgi:hypothetical protein
VTEQTEPAAVYPTGVVPKNQRSTSPSGPAIARSRIHRGWSTTPRAGQLRRRC